MKTVTVELTAKQVDLLRGILFEYYSTHNYIFDEELKLHRELEDILADAEDSF